MEKATISQLKNHLSAYLKKVRGGMSLLIVDRDEPIARLERISGAGSSDERVRRLEKAGLIRPGKRALELSFINAPLGTSGRSVVEALIDERRDGR